MPTYHFHCDTCSAEFALSLPFGSEEVPPCPTCKKNAKVKKIIRPPMIHFKGSGFYKTDSSVKTAAPKPVTEKKEEKKAESSPEKPAKTEKK